MCRVKLNQVVKMIVYLLPLSATHHQQVDKPTFGAIIAFPLSKTSNDQLEEAFNPGVKDIEQRTAFFLFRSIVNYFNLRA